MPCFNLSGNTKEIDATGIDEQESEAKTTLNRNEQESDTRCDHHNSGCAGLAFASMLERNEAIKEPSSVQGGKE